jgi:peptide/nickel transport system permease protein
MRTAGAILLLLIAVAGLCAGWLAPYSYATQDRESPSLAPSRSHPLGTDELGRDRWSRLLYGTRVSLTMAPIAALLTLGIAVLIGLAAGAAGGFAEQLLIALTDLFSSMPWLFLLLIVRAALPLNASPIASIALTFLLLGCLGWPSAARVVRSSVQAARAEGFLLQARALGVPPLRLWIRQFLPSLRPVLLAQFWISIPLFILSEANLGLLGLGVSEPLPSWGNLLFELAGRRDLFETPWLLAPAVCLVLTMLAMQSLSRRDTENRGLLR